jgi:hypothetical protein
MQGVTQICQAAASPPCMRCEVPVPGSQLRNTHHYRASPLLRCYKSTATNRQKSKSRKQLSPVSMQSRKDQLAREAMASAPAFYVALLLLLASVAAVHAVPPQAGTSSTCSTDLLRLLPCLPFIEGTATVPADTCCANLGSMVHDEPQCLCQALSNPSTAPVAVNMTRVMAMPRLCRLDLPPATGACAGNTRTHAISITCTDISPPLLVPGIWHSLKLCLMMSPLAVAGLLPHGPSPPLPPPPPPPAAAVTPHASANSSAPATLTTPATPTPTTPRMIPSPSVSSQTPPRYSRGSKMIADGFFVTLGLVALVSVLAF